MDIKCYLAITAAEFHSADVLPQRLAWMACHFSSYGTGLSNMPITLPTQSMVIVNDRTPPHGHDPHRIADQLNALTEELDVSCFLLDFQRDGDKETANIVRILCDNVTATIGVTEQYAKEQDCPVFIRTPQPNELLTERIAPWNGRKIWLEAAVETLQAVISKDGCALHLTNDPDIGETAYKDNILHCSYRTDIYNDHTLITMQRTAEDISALLQNAAKLGVELSVGLYQQLHEIIT